uniref:Uncharacterized protein n=1 Tax=Hyaloperonospora arabidopsidis (strain Emoy2) TaxID=559515 RepID=M4BKS1_HYAAE
MPQLSLSNPKTRGPQWSDDAAAALGSETRCGVRNEERACVQLPIQSARGGGGGGNSGGRRRRRREMGSSVSCRRTSGAPEKTCSK